MHPYLLHLGHLYLPTFGVLATAGLLLALALSQQTARLAEVEPDLLWDAGILAVVLAYVISRLLLAMTHWSAVVSAPVLLLAVPSLTPIGLLLTSAATLAWLRWKRVPLLRALDAWAPCAALVWAFLAVGHFAEGSDPGLPSGRLPGVLLPGDPVATHPVAVYAALVAALLAAAAYIRLSRVVSTGETAGITLAAAGIAQFLLCFLRQPGVSGWFGLDLLQWVALAAVCGGGCLVAFAPSTRRAA